MTVYGQQYVVHLIITPILYMILPQLFPQEENYVFVCRIIPFSAQSERH